MSCNAFVAAVLTWVCGIDSSFCSSGTAGLACAPSPPNYSAALTRNLTSLHDSVSIKTRSKSGSSLNRLRSLMK